MMEPLLIVILAVTLIHFVADFMLQTHWMATNKSKSNKALSFHILVYMGALFIGAGVLMGFLGTFTFSALVLFVLINGCAHFLTDHITSRATSALWAQEKTHDFFVVIGLDQVLHYLVLFTTAAVFLL